MAETPKTPTRKTRKATTKRSAPDAPVTAPPVTKKRSLNDGPTGRARRAEG